MDKPFEWDGSNDTYGGVSACGTFYCTDDYVSGGGSNYGVLFTLGVSSPNSSAHLTGMGGCLILRYHGLNGDLG